MEIERNRCDDAEDVAEERLEPETDAVADRLDRVIDGGE